MTGGVAGVCGGAGGAGGFSGDAWKICLEMPLAVECFITFFIFSLPLFYFSSICFKFDSYLLNHVDLSSALTKRKPTGNKIS